MRVNGSYPAPVLGVSTLADRNRERGFAEKQVNFRSDPSRKLTRRPSSVWKGVLVPPFVVDENNTIGVEKGEYHSHTYYRDGKEYRLLIQKQFIGGFGALVRGFVDGVEVTVTGNLQAYAEDGTTNWITETIEDTTYVLNPSKVVSIDPIITDNLSVQRVSHINVTSALNYGETVQVNINKSDGTRHSVSYTIPELGLTDPDYDTADRARATKQVALELAARINNGGTYPDGLIPNPDFPDDPVTDVDFQKFCNPYRSDGVGGCETNPDYDNSQSVCKPYVTNFGGVPNVTAVALGSSVAVWDDGGDWLELEVETGQGDRSCVAFNKVIERVTGLPLYAVVGTRITVRPDPTTDKGTYYLNAERIADDASGEVLEEVVWSESRDPSGTHEFVPDTLPFICRYEQDTNQFVVEEGGYRARLRGDNESNKEPDFVGKTINDIGYFQKRLVFLTENNVVMSETDDLKNFWKQSAVTLLATDTVSIASSATGTDSLQTLAYHNRDLLVGASNAQFKIDGTTAVTPQTISMPMTTAYEAQVQVKPVSLGNAVYFPIDYGDSSGIKEYTGERETDQDIADSITGHIIGYMSGKITKLVANANLNMLAITTDNGGDNTIYIYEFKRSNKGDLIQRAWSKWELPAGTQIEDLSFRQDKLSITSVDKGALVYKEIDMYSALAPTDQEIYLDDFLELDTDGTTVTLPDNYDSDDITIVRGIGTDYELETVQYTIDGTTITLLDDIGAGKVYIGHTYSSNYIPTRPFRYEEDGSVNTTDRLRVSKFTLSLVDTNTVSMKTISKHYEDTEQEFNSRQVGDIGNLIGEVPKFTGEISFSFSNDPALAKVEFICDNHLGCNIIDIGWEGKYYQAARRM